MKPRNTFYRRKLPHWEPPGATFFITWRLYGSLPQSAIERIEANRKLLEREVRRAEETEEARRIRHFKKLFVMYDAMLDQAKEGNLWLKEGRLASLVEAAMLHRYAVLYELWAYVVMPNHIHTFLKPKVEQTSVCLESKVEQISVCLEEREQLKRQTEVCPTYVPLKKITQSLKGYTALEANKILNRTGQSFWQDESYDHWSREDGESARIIAYIENNPVQAGLVSRPEDWQWSSASERQRRGLSEIMALT